MVFDNKDKNRMGGSRTTDEEEDDDDVDDDESSFMSVSGGGGGPDSSIGHGDTGYDEEEHDYDKNSSYDGGGSVSDLGSSSNITSKKKNKSIDDIPLASRETQAVNAGKCLVFGVLLLVAAAMAYLTYWFTTQDETDAFVISFNSFAQEILSVADSNAQQTLSIIKSFSTATTSYAFRADLKWPFVTIPDFEVRAQEALELSGAELILFTPIVSQLGGDAWGIYANQNQDWIADGLAYQNMSHIDPGNVLPIIHSPTSSGGGVGGGGGSGIQDSYAPLWQYAPAPTNAALVNLDMFQAFPWYQRLANGIDVVRHALLSEQVNVSYILPPNANETQGVTKMRSVTVHPVFESFDENATILGLLAAIHPWDAYFANVLPPGTGRIVVEVKDTCGSTFTYAVHGPDVEFLGLGLLHSHKYNDFGVSDEFATFARVGSGGSSDAAVNTTIDQDLVSCNYTLTIYPTDEFKASYASNKPIWYTSVVVLVFVFTAMVFVLYDWVVERRQAKVLSAAARTTAIIASLFPKQVQRRILQEAEEQALLDVQVARKTRGGRGFKRAAKSELKDFLGEHPDHAESNDNYNKNSNNIRKGKAIADLFPNTTIMFADIVGFTAWSSAREPAQVFELLETIYGHFDAMAAHRRVFKVETVGDCYVAVAGLPEPRKDHAIIMSRFARDCVVRFGKVTKDLENSLGPDTGDLALRVGLHSGPVTAGVLRGERARFQLFGDTVNTTARMESNGKPNKIQLSQETADILQNAGKSHWIQAREDMIKAKGKGELKTYWLIYKEGGEKTASVTMANSETVTMSNAPVDKIGQKVHMNLSLTAKHLRLVTWNRDLLAGKLNDVVARREACNVVPASINRMRELELSQLRRQGMVLDEVAEIIELPKFVASEKYVDSNDIQLEEHVLTQLENYIRTLSMMYRDNPFHNFEHASHVTLSVGKLFSRIIAPDLEYDNKDGDEIDYTLHDHTYGITSDPLTQFAVLLSALIHDVDHVGVPNMTLVQEKSSLAQAYQNKSVAEQNSIDVAWRTLMDDQYEDLRRTIYCNESEFHRFRQLVVNTVLATDIMDRDLKSLRNGRWEKAFSESAIGEDAEVAKNRKATIVIEHLIQASDIAHTMQHWHVYRKWNERLYREMHMAYVNGRAEKDPADFWFQGEIGFFDFYIIPLAKKLADCGIFGVSSDEYLTYAIQNRREWEQRGLDVVATYKESIANEKLSSEHNDKLDKPPSRRQLKDTTTTVTAATDAVTEPTKSTESDPDPETESSHSCPSESQQAKNEQTKTSLISI